MPEVPQMANWIQRNPSVAYYVIAVALSVGLGLLLYVSLLFGLLALFGPAVAAFLVARVSTGAGGTAALWRAATRWRVHPAWYLAAVAAPIGGYAVAHVAYILAGNPALAIPTAIEPIAIVLFFLVIGEEIGWRGFLLPRLLQSYSPLVATLIVWVAWAMWHSPLYFVPGMPSYGQSFLLFAAWVLPASFLLTWVWLGTRSAWLATIMHGSLNIGAAIAFPLQDFEPRYLFGAVGLAIVASIVVVVFWKQFVAPPETDDPARDGASRVPSPALGGP
jgi:membrane protease YdiL (CAAX protease family)